MEKGARDKPVPFALRDERAEQGSALEDLTADVLDAAPGGDLGQVDDDVDRDQRDGDRAGRQPCSCRPDRGRGAPRPAATPAHSGQRMPTGPKTMQSVQIKRSQSEQRTAVSTRGAGSRPCGPWFRLSHAAHRSGGRRPAPLRSALRNHRRVHAGRGVLGPTGIVVDVLRATSTVAQALAAGYRRSCAARRWRRQPRSGAGRRGAAGGRAAVRPDPGFDLGNSPREFLDPAGETVILTTTNGTRALVTAGERCEQVLAGSSAQPRGTRRLGAGRRRRCRHLCRRQGRVRWTTPPPPRIRPARRSD